MLSSNGEISKISRWEHGKEMELLKKFDGLTMPMFEKGKEAFSGRYYRKSVFEYVPIYPTEIETKSDSIISKKEKKKDCKCPDNGTDIFILLLNIQMYVVGVGFFEVLLLVIFSFTDSYWASVMLLIIMLTLCLMFVLLILTLCVDLFDSCCN